ncbi:hypothetical protein [Emticicia agri]|uniref:Uncharacterized protein n=1 Tax=Emticicia agri TaxID=2492393 RepID=A0A4Q5LVN6_9BACT|nr:hypothetical protein [Emticicia agri]RYU93724.1 hypothetical protein EWM59_20615 [Emticicia agri]
MSINLNNISLKLLNMSSISEKNASQLIKYELMEDKPTMIARFGSTEIKAILYPRLPSPIRSIVRERIFRNMEVLSGFFPSNDSNIYRFSELMIEDMQELDILGSWRAEEKFLKDFINKSIKVELKALEPYFSNEPWSAVLEGKKVLVINPFSETIKKQYNEKRKLLFSNKFVLPEFHLDTIQAVQTIARNGSDFKDWFEALNYMKSAINEKDFDIAIIGCGAYGFPLAAHIKRLGKKAIHLGGPTQILFGVKGKRWEENNSFLNIINEHFISPSIYETPKDINKVEQGCYW